VVRAARVARVDPEVRRPATRHGTHTAKEGAGGAACVVCGMQSTRATAPPATADG